MNISKDNLELALLGLSPEQISLIKFAIAGKTNLKDLLDVDINAYHSTLKGKTLLDAWGDLTTSANKLMRKHLNYTEENCTATSPYLFLSCSDYQDQPKLSIKLSTELAQGLESYPSDKLMDFLDSCVLPPLVSIGKPYSSKLYLLLSERCANGVGFISYEDLRDAFAINDSAYSLVHNFKRRILHRGISDIAESTNIKVSYKDVTDGRKIIGFDFLVEANNTGDPL